MKKTTKQLIALLIILGGCALIFCGVLVYNSWQEKKDAADKDASTVHIGDIQKAVEIECTNSKETLTFKLENDDWSCVEYPSFPLDTTTVKNIASKVVDLTAVREITDYDSLAEYGLDKPTMKLKVTDENGSTLDLFIGKLSGDGSNYYAMKSDSSAVYTIASLLEGYVAKTICDMAKLETFPTITEADIKSVTFTSGDNTAVLDKETRISTQDTGEKDSSGNAVTKDVTEYYWYLTANGGTRTFVNDIKTVLKDSTGLKYTLSDKLDAMLTGFGSLAYQQCVAYKASSDLLATYGFTKPLLTVTVAYVDDSGNDASYTLILGNEVPPETDTSTSTVSPSPTASAKVAATYYYAKFDGSDLVNTIAISKTTILSDMLTAILGVSAQ